MTNERKGPAPGRVAERRTNPRYGFTADAEVIEDGSGTRIELRVRTRSALPLVGGAATLLVNPLFLAPTFSRWLRNLARAAEQEKASG